MSESPSKAKEIFLTALEQYAPEQWPAFLEQACGGDDRLHAEVENLLRARAEIGSFHEAARTEWPLTREEPISERPGLVIGPYKLLQQLGEGGMGTVFMAAQTQPVQRKVALKVIKPDLDSHQVIARFEAERQALALMDHPNIAKVLDAGTTEGGRPYFVMELVKGVPITHYCDERRLTPKQRLELFIPVCQAVQHAHQKGIIHRDIKPSNVMVCLYDGVAVPKVIDFGIAKATDQQLTERTLFTEVGQVVGTLQYMSPEQAQLNQLDIDTRSDIYSLGVLLYELLTGSTPLDRNRLKAAAFFEVLRLIREEEPPKPSTRLSTTDEMPVVAANRSVEPRKLSGMMRGELDWIVMKALDKDRNRRYETANSFARDIRHYLADEPVQACPPSAGYRLRKFTSRHRGKLTVAVAMLLLLLAGTVVSTWQAVRATRAERKTSDALDQVTAEQARTTAALTAETAAKAQMREALDALTHDVVETLFARQPHLDRTEKAFLRKVLRFYESATRQLGQTTEARFFRASGYFKVAHLRALLGQPGKAEPAYRQALVLLRQLVDRFPDVAEYRQKLARTHSQLGRVLADLGKEAKAETAFRRSLALWKKLVADCPRVSQHRLELALCLNNLAFLLHRQKKYVEAEKAYRRALSLVEKLAADAVPTAQQHLARSRSNLGNLLRELGRSEEAAALQRLALLVQEKQQAEFPAAPKGRRELADSYHGLGIVLAEQGKGAEAERLFDKAIALRKKLVADYPRVLQYRRELATGYNDLGNLLRLQGKEAESAWRAALPLWKQLADSPKLPADRNALAGILGRLATLEIHRGDFPAALALLKQARPHQQAALKADPKNPKYRLYSRNNLAALAQCHRALGDHARLVATANELARVGHDPARDRCIAACMLGNCITVVENDPDLIEARRKELVKSYGNRALALLRQAVARGFKDADYLKNSPDLRPLRAREEFKTLLADLEADFEE